jgi:O-antigen ligase
MQPTSLLAKSSSDLRGIFISRSWTERFLFGSWLLIIALIPFHAFISTWGGSTIGPLEVWKSWKEILLLVDLFVACGYLWKRGLLKRFFSDKLVWLVFAYAALHLLLWLLLRPPLRAAFAGILMNLCFFAIFLLAGVLTTFVERHQLLRVCLYVVLGGGLLAIFFGLLQATVLPKDFLVHFGYSKATITPYTTLDSNESIVRLQSFLRGPNPLGQYLILIAAVLAGIWKKARKWMVAIAFIALLVVLALTYSRSAALALAAAWVIWVWLQIPSRALRRKVVIGGTVLLAVIVGAIAIVLPHSIALQNAILHNKQHDTDAGSTSVHFTAQVETLKLIGHHPFGQGPGTFGPASFYAPTPHIPEDYYLQIAGEIGVIGLAMFVTIIVVTAWRLWPHRQEFWPQILLVSLVGISVINLLLHGWADDTTAILWWGIAGLFAFRHLVKTP